MKNHNSPVSALSCSQIIELFIFAIFEMTLAMCFVGFFMGEKIYLAFCIASAAIGGATELFSRRNRSICELFAAIRFDLISICCDIYLNFKREHSANIAFVAQLVFHIQLMAYLFHRALQLRSAHYSWWIENRNKDTGQLRIYVFR